MNITAGGRGMTIDEIMACEIPEGIYAAVMRHLQDILPDRNTEDNCNRKTEIASLVAAFTALYKLANGTIRMSSREFNEAIESAKNVSRAERQREILAIVEEMGKEFEHLPTWHYDGRTLQEIRNRIEAKP